MALIEYDVYKQKLRDLEPELKKLGDALDIDAVAHEFLEAVELVLKLLQAGLHLGGSDHPVRDGPGGGG